MNNHPFWHGKTVFITGASSGIGEALARELARHGACLGLFARRESRLNELVKQIGDEGGRARPFPGDVTQPDHLRRSIEDFAKESGPIDVLIANAGRGMHGADETDAAAVTDVYNVNFLGAVHAFEAVLPAMRERGRGHIAVVSSGTALLRNLAASPTYASSKEALGRYFEGLGRELRLEGIAITVVYPGFVFTEMTAGHKWMPFAVTADHAARLIRRSIEKGRRRLLFPRRTFWLGRVIQLIPTRLQVSGRRRFSGRPRKEP